MAENSTRSRKIQSVFNDCVVAGDVGQLKELLSSPLIRPELLEYKNGRANMTCLVLTAKNNKTENLIYLLENTELTEHSKMDNR